VKPFRGSKVQRSEIQNFNASEVHVSSEHLDIFEIRATKIRNFYERDITLNVEP
jgi:hypothetical protein